MIVGEFFSGDDIDLSWIQHDLYFLKFCSYAERIEFGIKYRGISHGSCSYIFEIARASMFKTHSMLPIYQGKNLNEIETFDHRVLQNTHGKIAAFYRWLQSCQIRKPVLSGKDTQYRRAYNISEPMCEYHRYMLEAWKTYFVREIYDITHGEPSISGRIVESVRFQNTEKGYESEDAIDAFLTLRYGAQFEKNCRDWSKQK